MISELNKYTYEEFVQLDQEERDLYKAFGLRLKGKNPATKDVLEWEWAKVKQIQDIVNKREISYSEVAESVGIASGRDDVFNWYWYDVFAAHNFIVKEIEAINTREQELAYEPDAKELNAGVDRYQVFGWFATLNRLAGGDPLKYDAIGQQPYGIIFSTLLLQKADREYEKALINQNRSNV